MLTSWDYMWRITVLHRSEHVGTDPSGHLPPMLPAGVDPERTTPPETGRGPLFHRRYGVSIIDADADARELFARLCADLQQAAPGKFARFEKVLGEPGDVRVGDEYIVRMPGPWNGPVRVVDRQPGSFRLHTLTGHLEAGQIEFRVSSQASVDDPLRFEIESWTCSGDALANVLYFHLQIAKEVQAHMWISFLENVVKLGHGRAPAGVSISTERIDGLRAADLRVG